MKRSAMKRYRLHLRVKATGLKKKRPGRGDIFVPTQEQRAFVRELVAHGAGQRTIAKLIINPITGKPIDRDTLALRFREELDLGFELAKIEVARSIYTLARGREAVTEVDEKTGKTILLVPPLKPDIGAAIWWEKTRCGYREGTIIQHEGKDGAPLPVGPGIQVVVVLPPNGRDPQFEARLMQFKGKGNGKDQAAPQVASGIGNGTHRAG